MRKKYLWISSIAVALTALLFAAGCTSSTIDDPGSDQYLVISLIAGQPGAKGVPTSNWLLYVDCLIRLPAVPATTPPSCVVAGDADDMISLTVKNVKKSPDAPSGNYQDVVLERYRISYLPVGIIVDSDGDSIFEGVAGAGTGPTPYIPIGGTTTFPLVAAPTFSKPACSDTILTGTVTLWGRSLGGQTFTVVGQFTAHYANWVNDPNCP